MIDDSRKCQRCCYLFVLRVKIGCNIDLNWHGAWDFFFGNSSMTPISIGEACSYHLICRRRKEVIANWSHISYKPMSYCMTGILTNCLIGSAQDAIHLEMNMWMEYFQRESWSDEKYRFGMIELKPVWGGVACVSYLCVCVCMRSPWWGRGFVRVITALLCK